MTHCITQCEKLCFNVVNIYCSWMLLWKKWKPKETALFSSTTWQTPNIQISTTTLAKKCLLYSKVTTRSVLYTWIWITLTVPVFRLLSRPVKKGVDSDGTSVVQSSLQSSQTFRSGKAEGPSIHREHTSGKMTHLIGVNLRCCHCVHIIIVTWSQSPMLPASGTYVPSDNLPLITCIIFRI